MKVAVLMLSYERYDTLKQVLEHNMNNAGHPFDLYVWDNGSNDIRIPDLFTGKAKGIWCPVANFGIAWPLNMMARHCYKQGYDALHVMANDILEPDNWLADKIQYLQHIPQSGMISISPGAIPYPDTVVNGIEVFAGDVIGQFMISRQVWEKVGAFNEQFGMYGPIDNDYNARCAALDFVNYYIPGQSVHLDNSPANMYGYDKAAMVAKTWPVHVANVARYQADAASCYIPVDGECLINMKQFSDE